MANAQDEQKTIEANMTRARNLRNQIQALQQQAANAPDANQGAQASIDALQRELGSIPNSQAWS